MSRLRRPDLAAEVARRNQEQFARLGGEILVTRRRRRWTQQELGRRAGRPPPPAEPSRSSDAALRDDPQRTLILIECWNTIGNIGEGARSSSRKVAEAEGLAAVAGGDEGPYRVAACWVVRAARRNRELMARYPEVFAARFPGSSSAGSARSPRARHRRSSPDSSGATWPPRASSPGAGPARLPLRRGGHQRLAD